MKKLTPAPDWLIERPITHRGLHDLSKGRAENSLSAFQASIDARYAIEFDLRWSQSHDPMVFHDNTMVRMTGLEGITRDYPTKKLTEITLLETKDTIAPLWKHLDLVAGKVPLVMEVKEIAKADAKAFVQSIADAIAGYNGRLAVMSFSHDICRHFSSLMPDVPRGLTAEGGVDSADVHLKAMHDFDLQFVSYDVNTIPHPFVDQMREEGLPVITWTVDDEEKMARTYAHADQITFEGFLPDPTSRRTVDG